MAYVNRYDGMKCVIYFGSKSRETWLGFQQKRAELAARKMKGMTADELHRLKQDLISDIAPGVMQSTESGRKAA
ncbi:MAG: hypothetical protein SPL71_05780 [Oribacterium sp.]|nr:hypothetical protein [Oribacterium sp.]